MRVKQRAVRPVFVCWIRTSSEPLVMSPLAEEPMQYLSHTAGRSTTTHTMVTFEDRPNEIVIPLQVVTEHMAWYSVQRSRAPTPICLGNSDLFSDVEVMLTSYIHRCHEHPEYTREQTDKLPES